MNLGLSATGHEFPHEAKCEFLISNSSHFFCVCRKCSCVDLQDLQPHQKFERLSFWNGIKNYGVEGTLSGIISFLKFIKIYQLVETFIRHTVSQTDRHTNTQTRW
jgi:hypothetical protein